MNKDKNSTKEFVYQVITEIKKLFTSKFMIIIMLLILLCAIVVPVIVKTQSNKEPRIYYGNDMEDLNIDGHVISINNPQYWEMRELSENIKRIESSASTKTDDLSLEFMQILLDNLLVTASEVTTYQDYRFELSWQRSNLAIDKFIFENLDKPKENLINAIQYRIMMVPKDMDDKYYSLDQLEVLEKLQEIEDKLTRIDKIIINNDYKEFYRFEIDRLYEDYENNIKNIETWEKDILENPQNEEMYNEQIENLKKSNRGILEIQIVAYEYKMEHDIIPRSGDWREIAVDIKRNAQNQLLFEEMLTQEQFEENDHYKREHKTYSAYQKFWQKEVDKRTQKLLVANKSLETGKPDMEYVPNGSRKNVVNFLWYSMVIAIFGVIIGGGLIAREFQTGTIRLLLIRPKKRMKIMLSKLFALLIICFLLFLISALLNMTTNGILFGFGDFSFPNYTISSGANGVSFFGFYATKFLICFVTILFACATAYFMSIVTKNTALSVAVPLICFVGSLIGMEFIAYRPLLQWVVYTPLPYVNLANYFIRDLSYNKVQPILGFGIPLMIGLSIALIIAATYISKKRDITN